MDIATDILYLFLIILLISTAIGVIAFKNPIHSALCLILHMNGVAAIFASLDAHFLAVIQIIVYAGAIMVLVLFVLMLLNIKVEHPKPVRVLYCLLMGILGVVFVASLIPIARDAFSIFPAAQSLEGTIEKLATPLYKKYLIPFEAAALLLTATLVGAVMLARPVRKQQGEGNNGD